MLIAKEDGPWNRTFVSNIWGYSFRISRVHRGIPQPAVIHKHCIVFFLGQFRSGLDCSSSDMWDFLRDVWRYDCIWQASWHHGFKMLDCLLIRQILLKTNPFDQLTTWLPTRQYVYIQEFVAGIFSAVKPWKFWIGLEHRLILDWELSWWTPLAKKN